MHNSGRRTAPTYPVRPSPATILVGRCTSAGSVRHAHEKRHRTDVRTAHATPSVPKSGCQCRQGKGELPMRATLKRELYTLCDILLLLAVPGLVPPRHAYGQSLRPSSVEGAPAGHTGRGAEPGARPCAQLLDLLGIVERQDNESLLNSFRVPDFSGVFGFRCFTS